MTGSDNWRLRHTIANTALPELCNIEKSRLKQGLVFQHLLRIWLTLLRDGVSIVRTR